MNRSGQPDSPALELRRASFCYPGGVVALSNVSLTVPRGQKLAILGANGSGKSTLLMLLAGLAHPSPGSLRAFDEEISEASLRNRETVWRFRRRVGFVFQNSDAQLFSATVRDEIAFGPLQMGLPVEQVEQRLGDVAAMLGVTKLLDRPPFRLSGGEKKKVALAAVLVVNPQVVLLDEPTTGLDPRSQRWLVETLVELNEAGKTLVTATHDLGIVEEIADRVVVMSEEHTVEADGETCSVLEDTDLLLRTNLIHEHTHAHGTVRHSHPHHHDLAHEHDHS